MEPLIMSPPAGERLLQFVGDRLEFRLRFADGHSPEPGWKGFLRTNLGRARQLRHEIIHQHTGKLGLGTSSWRDIPMRWNGEAWTVNLVLTEVGYFNAKAYAQDPKGWLHWPDGEDFGVSIHPDDYRTGNTIYCAFTRMFGRTAGERITRQHPEDTMVHTLDKKGFTVIPPSGKLRDLKRHLPHIMDTLGCRILHLLPVHPTPTTYARFGRFGSPYACQDLMLVDPALVEFDRRTTGVDQFRELTHAAHVHGGRVFLDVVINHTGWGSSLQEQHPEWFVREADKTFRSPGAWGNTWEDLVEMHHQNPALWELLADVFLEWCRRGVDGFRCDAGYMIPVSAWKYITARVQDEFPETIFLLEGLGGAWEATEALLTEGSMQWAYSELFQNYSGEQVSTYLDYSLKQSKRLGLYVHYSETHDNPRLAEKGRSWALLRHQICALTSVSGGFGFTCGTEWLAEEKVNVHQSSGMSWGNPDNLVPELARLNHLLKTHPSFFDHAKLNRLSLPGAPVFALERVSREGVDKVLVLINTDTETPRSTELEATVFRGLGEPRFDLLTEKPFAPEIGDKDRVRFRLEPSRCLCLATSPTPTGLSGDEYRTVRSQAAWGMSSLNRIMGCENVGPADVVALAQLIRSDPARFLAATQHLAHSEAKTDLLAALNRTMAGEPYPEVVVWELVDARRICPLPPDHWLLVCHSEPFELTIISGAQRHPLQSIPVENGHAASIYSTDLATGEATLCLQPLHADAPEINARLLVLHAEPSLATIHPSIDEATDQMPANIRRGHALMTNHRGGMARMAVDLGVVTSKYDCVLGANLHDSVPVDRHIFVKRLRAWVNADGFITPLHAKSLVHFHPGPPAHWRFVASAGDGRAVEIHLTADMLPEGNTTILRFSRPDSSPSFGHDLPGSCRVTLTARFDILDRSFHHETEFNEGTAHHFPANTLRLEDRPGFRFTPAPERQLRIWSDNGIYHSEVEWSHKLLHPVESSRGQKDREDAFSPGWFELPLAKGGQTHLIATAEPDDPAPDELEFFVPRRWKANEDAVNQTRITAADPVAQQLTRAVQAFVVRRGNAETVVAGYPWFLDWGRDSLICARGLLTAGMIDDVRQLLYTFGRFADHGTLPNSIHGEDVSNRETSDAPLWYAIVAEDLEQIAGESYYEDTIEEGGRTMKQVLEEIARGYCLGTSNGIRMDRETGLIWSPSHFTWMDTNYPAGTPREGYPVEIQALWVRLCRLMDRLDIPAVTDPWRDLADRAAEALSSLFWLESHGYPADLLQASEGQPARNATPDTALRSNCLLAVSLDLIGGSKARRTVEMARRHLVVPGALRSLAPLPVTPPLAIHGKDGKLLNQPDQPYWGRYEGEEDTCRKPAYHNGTAWTWPFPVFCEALAKAWDLNPSAVRAARAYLASVSGLLESGCLGHLPEIIDGDAPHQQRGCDAQAWGSTEALRVWAWLKNL